MASKKKAKKSTRGGARPGAGRPKGSTNGKPVKSAVLYVKTRYDQLEAYQEQAAAEGLSLSEWTRRCLDARVKRGTLPRSAGMSDRYPKAAVLYAKVLPDQLKAYQEQAAAKELSLSAWTRRCLDSCVGWE